MADNNTPDTESSLVETQGIPEITLTMEVSGMTQYPTDKTLAVEDMPADGKYVGLALEGIRGDIGDVSTAIQTEEEARIEAVNAVDAKTAEDILTADESETTIADKLAELDGKTGADIDVSGTDTRKISAAIGSVESEMLKKTAQELSMAEKTQVFSNLGIADVATNGLTASQQTLSAQQKSQVHSNLGLTDLVENGVKASTQTLTTAQKQQVFNNLGIEDLVENGVRASAQTLTKAQKLQALDNEGIGNILRSNVFTVPADTYLSSGWQRRAGGYIQIGCIVIVCMAAITTATIPAGNSNVYEAGAFPIPLQDEEGDGLTLSSSLLCTRSGIYPFISSSGQLRFSGSTAEQSEGTTQYFSGMYITGNV